MNFSELQENEYPAFYSPYIKALDTVNLIEDLEISLHQFIKFVQNIPMDKFDYKYAFDKWTIKEIIQHLIDTERVFSYRAMRISRNDKTDLPGFDQNLYIENTNANVRGIQDLLAELSAVRFSTLYLFKSLSAKQLLQSGTIEKQNVSCRALGFLIIGHQKHHHQVFQDLYL